MTWTDGNHLRPFSTLPDATAMEAADVVVFGAPHGTPYEGVDNTPFARAPQALREASGLEWSWIDHHDFDLGGPMLGDPPLSVMDAGDLPTTPNGEGPANRAKIAEMTRRILGADAVPMMIGGDDSVPIPFIEVVAEAGPLTIVQVDAHIDWRQERRGEPMGYSSTMRRASEIANVERIVQVGIRGLGSARPEEVRIARDWGAEIVTAREIHRDGIGAALANIPIGARCLLTFDCDALDAGIMPAVMAPTPGGLSYTQAIDLVAGIGSKARLAAVDIIEFVSERDLHGTAAVTMARILWNAMGAVARSRKR